MIGCEGNGVWGEGTGGIPFPRTIAENIQFLCNIAAKIEGGVGGGGSATKHRAWYIF
jgi:hypothetical protein